MSTQTVKKAKQGGLATKTLVLAGLTVFTGLVLAPFLVVLINAFKSSEDYSQGGPLALPSTLYFQGMIDFWNRVEFGEKLWNSFVIAASVAVLAVIISVLNAYAIGIGRLRGRTAFLMFFLLANCCRRRRWSTRCTTCRSSSTCTTRGSW